MNKRYSKASNKKKFNNKKRKIQKTKKRKRRTSRTKRKIGKIIMKMKGGANMPDDPMNKIKYPLLYDSRYPQLKDKEETYKLLCDNFKYYKYKLTLFNLILKKVEKFFSKEGEIASKKEHLLEAINRRYFLSNVDYSNDILEAKKKFSDMNYTDKIAHLEEYYPSYYKIAQMDTVDKGAYFEYHRLIDNWDTEGSILTMYHINKIKNFKHDKILLDLFQLYNAHPHTIVSKFFRHQPGATYVEEPKKLNLDQKITDLKADLNSDLDSEIDDIRKSIDYLCKDEKSLDIRFDNLGILLNNSQMEKVKEYFNYDVERLGGLLLIFTRIELKLLNENNETDDTLVPKIQGLINLKNKIDIGTAKIYYKDIPIEGFTFKDILKILYMKSDEQDEHDAKKKNFKKILTENDISPDVFDLLF
jgi:hypothetical protein